nr:hypothetical protein [Tanacetum cinerariifolium]
MQKRRNDVKARTTLLLALPDEHQLRFSKYNTAQELWAAILKTFGGNEATKKTKKNLLKQRRNEEVNTASISTAGTQVSPSGLNVPLRVSVLILLVPISLLNLMEGKKHRQGSERHEIDGVLPGETIPHVPRVFSSVPFLSVDICSQIPSSCPRAKRRLKRFDQEVAAYPNGYDPLA